MDRKLLTLLEIVETRELVTGIPAKQVYARCLQDKQRFDAVFDLPLSQRIAALADVVSRAEETF